MNVITTVKKAISTARLRREVNRLEAARDELAKRDVEAAHAEEIAAQDAEVKRNAARVSELTKSYVKTADDAAEAARELDLAILGLKAWQRRDTALVQLRDLHEELHRLGAETPTGSVLPISDEATAVAQDLWTPLGLECGVAVTTRPLLVFR